MTLLRNLLILGFRANVFWYFRYYRIAFTSTKSKKQESISNHYFDEIGWKDPLFAYSRP